VDYYLRIKDSDSLGIKLREGRIEFKQRYGRQDAVCFGTQSAGTIECWRKWSFALADTEGSLAALGSSTSTWIGVRKARFLHTYRVLQDGTIVAVEPGFTLNQGCGWELVTVTVEGSMDPWWSIGFEAFGNEGERWNTIVSVAEHFLSSDNSPALDLEASYGYPKWLQMSRS
jgi:hypothetical protein